MLAHVCPVNLWDHWLAEQKQTWQTANIGEWRDEGHHIFAKNSLQDTMSKIIFPSLICPILSYELYIPHKTRDRRASFAQVGRSPMGLGSFNSFAEAGGAVVLGPKMNFWFDSSFAVEKLPRLRKEHVFINFKRSRQAGSMPTFATSWAVSDWRRRCWSTSMVEANPSTTSMTVKWENLEDFRGSLCCLLFLKPHFTSFVFFAST